MNILFLFFFENLFFDGSGLDISEYEGIRDVLGGCGLDNGMYFIIVKILLINLERVMVLRW